MTGLLELPSELPVPIFEELGGRNLRRNVSNLTICRKWYQSAHEVYLSGLETRTIQIFGCDIKDLADKRNSQNQRLLMHKNTRKLYIRLLGHWWDENHKSQITDDSQIGLDNAPPAEFRTPEGRVMQWQKTILNPAMDELFRDLSRMEVLEDITLETSLDSSDEIGPQWEFLDSSTVATFLQNLPITHDLQNLTLDLGSGLNYDEPENAHICDDMAKILPGIESVRLRLKLICTSVFPSQEALRGRNVRLKSLILKLHMPEFQSTTSFDARSCVGMEGHHGPNARM